MYSKNFNVLFHDTDINGNLYMSKILMYMQETTNHHMASIGKHFSDMRTEEGVGFWLMRVGIKNFKPVHEFDDIQVRTWPTNDSRGFSFNRCFQIIRGDEIVAQAYTVWALMSFDTMRPVKVSDYKIDFELEDPIDIGFPLHVRIPPVSEMSEVGKRTIRYSDIDYNGHMNNTRYPDMICDFIPDMNNRFVREMSISFQHEAAMGETLTAYFSEGEGGVYNVKTIRSDGKINIEARVVLENI